MLEFAIYFDKKNFSNTINQQQNIPLLVRLFIFKQENSYWAPMIPLGELLIRQSYSLNLTLIFLLSRSRIRWEFVFGKNKQKTKQKQKTFYIFKLSLFLKETKTKKRKKLKNSTKK